MDKASLEADGWTSFDPDGYSRTVGPVWLRGKGAETVVGMIVEPRHSNNHMGTLHGGALMTFADIALGIGAVQQLGQPRCATLQMQMQFITSAAIGEFLTCRPEVLRSGKRTIFMRGVFSVDDRIIASADAIWRVFEEKSGT